VTVRALHHYDEIGLLAPSARSEAGYRLYSHADLLRLQEILVWRELGFPLSEIQAMLDEPGYDRGSALRRQRELVDRELERLSGIAGALDAALKAHANGTRLEETTMFEGFDHSEYAEEVLITIAGVVTPRNAGERIARRGSAHVGVCDPR
jgi:MerR family transcriptional regulator, thiopeptide resistance regulator